MLAFRDQENLVHSHQTAAAAKPLNQSRAQGPKTPGPQRLPKTPFRRSENDENKTIAGKTGKTTLKTTTGVNALNTPAGLRTRAPLGAKTTNAKAKSVNTPSAATQLKAPDLKTNQQKPQTQKPKTKSSHGLSQKLEVLGDVKEDDAEPPDIEYMPPPVKNLPDLPPDDMPPLDLPERSGPYTLTDSLDVFMSQIGTDGLTPTQREERRQASLDAIWNRKLEALLQRDRESIPVLCTHEPLCEDLQCKDNEARRQEAQTKYEREIAIIEAEPAPKKQVSGKRPGPTQAKAKEAVANLSQPRIAMPSVDPIKRPAPLPASRLKFDLNRLAEPKHRPPPILHPSSTMRHEAAVSASKNTLGRQEGRKVSREMHKAKAPSRTPLEGTKPEGTKTESDRSKMSSSVGYSTRCVKDEREEDGGRAELDAAIRRDALEDFRLTLD